MKTNRVPHLSILRGGFLLLALTSTIRAQDLLKRVDDHYNHLTSLRCRYLERYTGMGLNRAESGTLLLKKPGKMLWRYDTPVGKVFVLDGKFAWFYTPGDPQAQRIRPGFFNVRVPVSVRSMPMPV